LLLTLTCKRAQPWKNFPPYLLALQVYYSSTSARGMDPDGFQPEMSAFTHNHSSSSICALPFFSAYPWFAFHVLCCTCGSFTTLCEKRPKCVPLCCRVPPSAPLVSWGNGPFATLLDVIGGTFYDRLRPPIGLFLSRPC